MQSITTKYLPAGARGARIKATTTRGLSASVPYPYELSDAVAHFEAVKAVNVKHNLDWDIDAMSYGSTKNGYVFVFTDSKI